ncbi:hypothetical protein COX69_01725 [Candidatus Falkowbacteria bacterium CG_4_10_14_0_2_um_filter_48_10]|uniref:Uncharacterized protein n=1 Tax=Candidatus Falkowbacteria bacterium CG23_combo_of_CG06-09_8_20_14_all_49_15 TaxID=1974572 RepID=A0A2G9ZK44_9BACT|nr:MAG: hypothetical protein COX22_03940 [Candidatus Falkowbacteria bacterium CG23_combo_of_CG06-09_8_20_14_all_49_15]PJA08643.1 MAG: hypothetical protein COX69_01725 [Candidatus Falkowbacteria bacterium CG_4_10_14_0_2_um_filter_48_10]
MLKRICKTIINGIYFCFCLSFFDFYIYRLRPIRRPVNLFVAIEPDPFFVLKPLRIDFAGPKLSSQACVFVFRPALIVLNRPEDSFLFLFALPFIFVLGRQGGRP